ncbi:MAG: chloride channel protein [Gammaproteobacteria bacterium]|nr:MAG: chloride channel protein [Gammaproteobacteria bacterium]
MLAIPVGLLSGGVIILFRLLVESTQGLLLNGSDIENYETLAPLWRLLLPLAGGLLIGLIWQTLKKKSREVGILHVMERLNYHQGQLPVRNALAQFVGAGLSIISGHSVGREGPSVHLGATSGSQLGRWLHLPNNSKRTLVACGIAAAIAASFNTPLAGVIFAMEVVMMEYSLVSFAPVILAAVTATTLSRAVYGSMPAFLVPNTQFGSLLELPYVVLMGLVIGILAALFIFLLQRFTGLVTSWPVWSRCTLAGLSVGLIAMVVPEVMGIGYDTVNQALLGNLGLLMLASIALTKLIATAAGLGLGLPGGLIGPTLVIGAAAGGAMGIIADDWLPGDIATPAFYAMIGMGTMMGATLQAPLAALTAMLELTANPNIILPGMLALITGGLVSRELFGKESVYIELMQTRGLDYRHNPLAQALRRIGVASVMERRLEILPPEVDRETAAAALANEPVWILVTVNNKPVSLMPAADLALYLQGADSGEPIDLLEIPADRHEIQPIDFQATLREALSLLKNTDTEALYVIRRTIPGIDRVYGILTRKKIERSYSID